MPMTVRRRTMSIPWAGRGQGQVGPSGRPASAARDVSILSLKLLNQLFKIFPSLLIVTEHIVTGTARRQENDIAISRFLEREENGFLESSDQIGLGEVADGAVDLFLG